MIYLGNEGLISPINNSKFWDRTTIFQHDNKKFLYINRLWVIVSKISIKWYLLRNFYYELVKRILKCIHYIIKSCRNTFLLSIEYLGLLYLFFLDRLGQNCNPFAYNNNMLFVNNDY